VSLIFEALKKLDREKQTPERGVVVLGATTWAARREGRSRVLLQLATSLALLAVGAAVAVWWLAPGARSKPASGPSPSTNAATGTLAPVTPAPIAAPSASSLPPYTALQAQAPTSVRPVPPPGERAARTRPAPTPSVTPAVEPFALQAVTEQDGEPVALINQRVLRVGEGFDGMRVLRITPTEVEIEIEASGRRQTLMF
jgi:hypothetical protein